MVGDILKTAINGGRSAFRYVNDSMVGQVTKKTTSDVLGKQVGLNKSFVGWTAAMTATNLMAGDSFGSAVGSAAVSSLAFEVFGAGPVMAFQLATMMPGMALGVSERVRSEAIRWDMMHKPNFGGNYHDTQQALTMRQQAVQAISGSKMNARSALGGEGRLMHRPYQYG